jgi:hypothetical protein
MVIHFSKLVFEYKAQRREDIPKYLGMNSPETSPGFSEL